MKSKLNLFATALLLAGADSALAAVHYVDVNNVEKPGKATAQRLLLCP